MITPLCFQKLQLLQNFAPRIIAAEPRRAKGMTKSVRYEVSLYLGSFSHIFFLLLGLRKSFVIPMTPLYRGLLYRGSTVTRKRKYYHDHLFNHRYDGIQNSTWPCCRFGRGRVRNLIWEVIAYERVQSKTVFEWEGKWLLPPKGFRPKGKSRAGGALELARTLYHILPISSGQILVPCSQMSFQKVKKK